MTKVPRYGLPRPCADPAPPAVPTPAAAAAAPRRRGAAAVVGGRERGAP